ncbi:MAG: type II secretion system F family protein [Actinobacteria bacterium]|nr:type II secretion system F family protein [Actinomycetota bacterium]
MGNTFVYKVKDNKGNLISGHIDGDGLGMVAKKLREMGYTVIDLKEKSLAQRSINLSFLNKVNLKDLTVFSRQFATMINAGLPLTKCLGILAEQTERKALKEVIADLLQDVEGGKALSDAMAKHTTIFPPLFVNMVRAGETGGVLDEVLLRVAEHFEKESSIRSKIKSAMAYPVAVFTIAMFITFAIITFLVPTFAKMFQDMGGAGAVLPLPTQILVSISDFTRSKWMILVVIALGLAGYGFKRYVGTETGRENIDKIKLRIPIIGGLVRKMSVSRFSRTFSTLLSSGVPVLLALDIVADSSGNAVVAAAVKKTRNSIKEGETIARPLTGDKIFPPMVVQMIAVGEETGALDTMLSKIADFYDREVSGMVDTLTSILEPLMLVGMGIIIGGIIISLYLPIFQLSSLVK